MCNSFLNLGNLGLQVFMSFNIFTWETERLAFIEDLKELQKIFGEFWSLWQRLENKEDYWTKIELNTESVRKLSNFNFQWTKISHQNNFNHIAFFFTLFEGYKCHKLYERTPNKRFLWSPSKQTSKASNFLKMKSYAWRFYLCFLNLWNLKFVLSGCHKNLSFGVISHNFLHL